MKDVFRSGDSSKKFKIAEGQWYRYAPSYVSPAYHVLYGYPFFFFQAEDGIRDGRVTGVQTCALPICPAERNPVPRGAVAEYEGDEHEGTSCKQAVVAAGQCCHCECEPQVQRGGRPGPDRKSVV